MKREHFPAQWIMFRGRKGGGWLPAGRYKVHLTDGGEVPWCGNPPPPNSSSAGICPSHPSQVCAACRAIAIERKLRWDNVLWVPPVEVKE